MSTPSYGPGIEIIGRITPEYAEILTPESVAFAARLPCAPGDRREKLLARRTRRLVELDAGRARARDRPPARTPPPARPRPPERAPTSVRSSPLPPQVDARPAPSAPPHSASCL